jgi:AAA family ATP:ADP antiporter
MTPRPTLTHAQRLAAAMLCAATVTGQFVAGKALRDTLFLTSLDVTSLPAMLIGTSVVSLALVGLNGRFSNRVVPAVLVPASFVLSSILFLIEWGMRPAAPTVSAIILYLHISAVGPLLASGFWLIASEQFDPHTAKRRFGQMAGAGTIGGLVSALIAERAAAWFGTPAILPILAVLQFTSGLLVRHLASGSVGTHVASSSTAAGTVSRSGLRVIAGAPYLRHLALLVLLGTTGAALVDYLFKAEAVQTFGRGDQLLRFFALYYAGTSIITFILQASSTHVILERYGLGATASTPSIALLLGSLGGLFAPGFGSLLVARGGESILRSSWFRAGYELFYTPIPNEEKRAAKSLIDVAFDRLGDATGGALVRIALVLVPAAHTHAILMFAVACSLGAIFAASRLNRGYVGSLQASLANRSGLVAGSTGAGDRTTRTLMRTLLRREALGTSGPAGVSAAHVTLDGTMADVLHLRSHDRARIVSVLGRDEGLSPMLVPHVIPLLAWDKVAEHATFALQKVAEEHVGQFADALVNPNQDFAVRRRLARVFSVCVSQRAVDGLMIALDDLRFAVRAQAGRSLLAILDRNPLLRIDKDRILEITLREVTVGRPVWEGRRLLDEQTGDSQLDAFVRDRAGESLAHVFTLLSLVLPREPLQLAFRGLHTDDEHLRGTALEYLDSVLPGQIRQRLWPFLEQRPSRKGGRTREEAIAALLRSNQSIVLNLEELRRRRETTSVVANA